MFSKQVRSWLFASAITVTFAVVLLTVAVPTPAEAGGRPLCFTAHLVGGICEGGVCKGGVCVWDPFESCSEVRADCRTFPGYGGYKKLSYRYWKQICGDELVACPPLHLP